MKTFLFERNCIFVRSIVIQTGDMDVIYEDNHLIAVNKNCHEIVHGDKTGDTPLSDILKTWLKEKYAKPGNVFVGVTHRLDRPVTGVVLFAKTSKALARINEMFRTGNIQKTYLAITKNCPDKSEGELRHWIVRDEKQNKSVAFDTEKPNAQQAILYYRMIAKSERYYLLEIDLKTGRHHQIRCQLAKIGCPVKGDLKYGAFQPQWRHQPPCTPNRFYPPRLATTCRNYRPCTGRSSMANTDKRKSRLSRKSCGVK